MEKDELARIIHEALEQLGWSDDAEAIAERVLRLDLGLPVEDEFSILCGWLGKCDLIHKLDQHQHPGRSRKNYQVPDLLAVFSYRGRRVPVLIEVKSSNQNTLTFRPDYRDRLLEYATLLDLPLLVAWKNRWGIWVLVDIRTFDQPDKNYNLSFETAMKENLLGVLAGDFSYSLSKGAGIHISMKKIALLGTEESGDEKIENWKMKVDRVFFSGSRGQELRDLSANAQGVLSSWDLEDQETHTKTHVIKSFVCQEPSMLFAHKALTRLLKFSLPGNEEIHWRRHLDTRINPEPHPDFR